MQVRVIRFLLIVLLNMMILPGIALAQDDEAHEFVIAAVENTVAQGYSLNIKIAVTTSITQEDGFVTTTYNLQNVIGDVTADGDRELTWESQAADTFENAMESEALVVEQIVSDGVNYVNFNLEDTMYADMLEIAPGWWEYDHLLESADSAIITGLLQPYGRAETPLDNLFSADTIVAIEEREPETIDAVAVRVFDIELDGLQLLLLQTPGSDEEKEQMLAESADLLAASDISSTYRLWIGADDDLVYRGKGESRSFIPYASAGSDNDPDFDIDTNSTVEFTILQHGADVDITPPDADSLNE